MSVEVLAALIAAFIAVLVLALYALRQRVRAAEAGAFKRAAHLALSSVKNWIRADGSGHVVKNRYPVETRHGHERYSQHTCYNMLACSMLAQAWQFADEHIEEKPCPADVGGFVVVPTDLPYFTAEFDLPDPAGL